jgi:hypothetical protein
MSRHALADAYDRLGDAYKQTARALRGDEPDAPVRASVPGPEGASAAPPPRSSAPADSRPQFKKCPAHDTEFKPSKHPNGPAYCTSRSDDPDPAWTNDRGYCRIDARNVFAWLKQHPQGAPARPAEDVDDIPF